MKRVVFAVMLLGLMLIYSVPSGMAQNVADQVETLQISFWPDFDQPSVLVLITGQLPANVTLPARVEIPVPDEATINAVAQIDDIGMVSVDYEESDGSIAFSPTNPRFRVEYYVPYEKSGSTRSYDFEWQAGLSVNELAAEVQQPANATSLETDPGADDVFTNQGDGLVYHSLAPVTVPAGMPFSLRFSYDMTADGLTSSPASSAPETAVDPLPVPQSTAAPIDSNNWLLMGGGLAVLLLAIAGTWYLATRSATRKPSRPPKPKPKARTASRQAAVYCHVCGQQAEGDDRFCRNCGTELKR